MIIAVTGGMGGGKSAVAALLGRLLASEVISADLLCRELLRQGNLGWVGVRERWGDRFLSPTGELDRVVLRRAVFDDADVRLQLEQILHPLVRQQILEQKMQMTAQRSCLVVEVPLLFEAGWQDGFSPVLAVYADQAICVERIVQRDGVSEKDARKAVAAQLPLFEKVMRADSVINNSGAWCSTVLQVYHLVHGYRQERLRVSDCAERSTEKC